MDLSPPPESFALEIQVEICKESQVVSSEPELQSYCLYFAQNSLGKEVNHGRLSLHVGYNIQPLLSHWEEVTKFSGDTKSVIISS